MSRSPETRVEAVNSGLGQHCGSEKNYAYIYFFK